MANFYAKVKQLIKNCDISFIEPLSYIKHITESENADAIASDKIVLLYKKGYASTPSFAMPIKQEDGMVKNESGLLDLTGSPLKDSCQFDSMSESLTEVVPKGNAWNDNDETYQCITLSETQSHFNTILSECSTLCTPKVWSICDSDDSKTMLLSIQINGNKRRRGILKFMGIENFEPINMAALQAEHMSYVGKQYGQLEGMIDSYYQLGNDALLQVSRSVNGSMPQSILTDGKTTSKMTLHQSVPVNNYRSVAHKFWIQLGILDDIKQTIATYKETRDLGTLIFSSFGSSEIGVIKQEIYDMLTQPIPIGVTDEDEMHNHKPNTNIDKVVLNAGSRVSGDLTDQLWDCLKACSSYQMLKEAIEYIFTSAAKINVVNMPSSQSRLAHLIRDVSDHRVAIPRLSGSEPLELLLEIGMEKVNKDYEFIFTESKLCTGEELRADKKLALANGDLNVRKSLKTQFMTNGRATPRKTLMHTMNEQMELNDSKEKIGFQNSNFNLKNVEADLARLGRIHLILEHLIKIKLNLNLENVFTTFLEDFRKPLIPFGVLKEMSKDFRIIPVTNTKILTKIANIPHRLRVFFKSRNNFMIFRNTFYYCADPIFPPHVFKCIENNETKSEVYFAHHYLEIDNI